MKKLFVLLWLLTVPVAYSQRDRVSDPEDEPLPAGAEVMASVRSQLPQMPLELTGFVRTRQGKTLQNRRLVSTLRFGDKIPTATYSLADNFGDPLTRVEVSWLDGKPNFAQRDADGKLLPIPSPQDEVADTGLTWSDLSLDFLWWTGAKSIGREIIKTRSSVLLALPAPPERTDVAEIKLWVDERAWFIVKAELYDAKGELLRSIEVDKLRKVREDFWMVQDLEIYDRPNRRKIGIRFEDVVELGDGGEMMNDGG